MRACGSDVHCQDPLASCSSASTAILSSAPSSYLRSSLDMSLRKPPTNEPNGQQSKDDDRKRTAMAEYQMTEGHFSLVRNFRLADLVTIANGICGSFSIFMSAKYLLTNDEDYLWSALVFPLAGLIFDFLDGKVARWRNESSMIGQELDSLADLVRRLSRHVITPGF
ncbi:hypothetical protein NUW54_g13381 [Trametes sanguinea]|uniref:Uncharacterized protein n=1 Tax=Trametes sanguinea TaxID=158606 RepID=A0ACC1MMW3_9APHY|nr:hypothetical protein NUW54_g13381 [Trametes sanguinea]